MMQRCHIASEELKAIVAAGEIKAWPYRMRTGMTAIYTLPGAKDPRTPEMVKGEAPQKPEKRAAPTKKKVRTAVRVASHIINPLPSNGSGPFAAVIADLERRRDVINNVIEAMRALA
jgi:hypothetical protein